jgi:hypothetical protein
LVEVEVTVELVVVEEGELVPVELLGAGRHWKNPENNAE